MHVLVGQCLTPCQQTIAATAANQYFGFVCAKVVQVQVRSLRTSSIADVSVKMAIQRMGVFGCDVGGLSTATEMDRLCGPRLLANHNSARKLVVPPLFAWVKGDPEEAQEERDHRNEVPRVPAD